MLLGLLRQVFAEQLFHGCGNDAASLFGCRLGRGGQVTEHQLRAPVGLPLVVGGLDVFGSGCHFAVFVTLRSGVNNPNVKRHLAGISQHVQGVVNSQVLPVALVGFNLSHAGHKVVHVLFLGRRDVARNQLAPFARDLGDWEVSSQVGSITQVLLLHFLGIDALQVGHRDDVGKLLIQLAQGRQVIQTSKHAPGLEFLGCGVLQPGFSRGIGAGP